MELVLDNISQKETIIANALRDIYSSVVLYESYEDDSDLLKTIIDLVEKDIERDRSSKLEANIQYRRVNTHELANAFLERYEQVFDRARIFASSINKRYGHTIDVASIVGPYILYLFGVTDVTLSFYITLGLALSNVICDSLANSKDEEDSKEKERAENQKNKTICRTLLSILEVIEDCDSHSEIDNKELITQCKNEIKKIVDDLDKDE